MAKVEQPNNNGTKILGGNSTEKAWVLEEARKNSKRVFIRLKGFEANYYLSDVIKVTKNEVVIGLFKDDTRSIWLDSIHEIIIYD